LLNDDCKVKIRWSYKNKSLYELAGYFFTAIGDELYIYPSELTKGSSIRVNYTCDNCGKSVDLKYRDYIKKDKRNGDICNQCSYIVNKRTPPKKVEDIIFEIEKSSNCVFIGNKEEYKDANSSITLKCICGEIFITTTLLFRHEDKKQCDICGLKLRIGENHYNWRGGVTSENYRARATSKYHKWRDGIYKRDNYTCKKCGDKKGGNLEAHHILNFSDHIDIRYDLDNGITLCKDCHSKGDKSFHSIYGTHNNTKEQLEEFLKI